MVVAIDDDPLFLMATAQALASAGMVCHTATTGEDGLRLIRAHGPDLVLLDILLNGEAGFSLCREIRRTWSPEELPVVLITGLDDLESIRLAYEAGANDFIAKPLHWPHLPHRIRHVLRASRDISELRRTEAALLEREERYRAFFEYGPDGVIVLDPATTRPLEFNDQVCRQLGYTRQEFQSLTVADIEAIETAEDTARRIRSVLATGITDFETRQRTKGGEVRDIHVTAQPIRIGETSAYHCVWRDITDRKTAERALLKSERFLREAQAAGGVGCFSLDINLGIWESSEAFDAIFGIGPDYPRDISGWLDLVAPAAREEFLRQLQDLIQGKGRFELEFRIRRSRDGQERWVAGQGSLEFDSHGQTTRLVGTMLDITGRKRTEDALRESEEEYRRLVRDMQVGVLLQDPRTEIMLCNPKALELLGISADQLLGKTSFDPEWNVIHEDGSPFPAPTHPVPMAIASGHPVRKTIMGVYHPVGKNRVWLSVDAEPQLNADGTVRQVLCTFIDITDLKQAEAALRESEERFKSLHNASFGGISIHDKGIILECNQGLSVMTGYSRDELIGMNGLMLIDPDSRNSVLDKILSGYEKPYECLGVRKNGERFPMQLEGRNIIYQGNPVRTVEFRDITERKQAEAENAKLQAQLQQSQKMESLGILAGGVAHDINNVLGAILGMATATIAAQPLDSPTHHAFETISQAAVRGGKMVKSLLSFARQNPTEEHQLDLNSILHEEVGFLERTTLAKINLELDLAENLPPILGDASALTHAFMNLCVNAVDAMPDRGTLTLRTRKLDDAWIEVVVEDTGVGMPKDVLEKAVDPFFTTKEVGKGTGLGLSMVYGAVKAHHGQLEIESEPGTGTRVRIRFPACGPRSQVPGTPAEPQSRSCTRALQVLLVDDDELIQESFKAILEALGHRVTTALSGEEALGELEAGFQPEVVILDMNMPGLGGAGTLPRLRALLPEVPVLLSTGRVDQTVLDLAATHPGVTLLSKPFGMKELQQQLEICER